MAAVAGVGQSKTTIQDLLDEVDAEARQRSRTLEALGRLPSGFADHYYPLTPAETRELRRYRLCAQLAAGDPDVYLALAKRRPVPRARLNQSVIGLLERWPR